MIWVLVVIVCIIVTIILKIFYEKYLFNDVFEYLYPLFLVISTISIVIIGTIFGTTHIGVDYNIHNSQIEYEGLVKRLEIVNSEYEDVSKSDVIKDISEWNKKVYSTKHWAESPWTSWLCSQKYADSLQYIDIEGGVK